MAGNASPEAPRGVPLSPQQLSIKRIRERAETGGGYEALSDMQRAELIAHRVLPRILASQKTGEMDAEKDPWTLAVDVATRGFEKRFGRAPTLDGPLPANRPTSVEAELLKDGEAVKTVVVPSLLGLPDIQQVPADDRKRARGREKLAAVSEDVKAMGVGAGAVGTAAVRGAVALGAPLVQTAGGGLALLLASMGLISEEQYDGAISGLFGQTDEESTPAQPSTAAPRARLTAPR